jgi:hypothetical protein
MTNSAILTEQSAISRPGGRYIPYLLKREKAAVVRIKMKGFSSFHIALRRQIQVVMYGFRYFSRHINVTGNLFKSHFFKSFL